MPDWEELYGTTDPDELIDRFIEDCRWAAHMDMEGESQNHSDADDDLDDDEKEHYYYEIIQELYNWGHPESVSKKEFDFIKSYEGNYPERCISSYIETALNWATNEEKEYLLSSIRSLSQIVDRIFLKGPAPYDDKIRATCKDTNGNFIDISKLENVDAFGNFPDFLPSEADVVLNTLYPEVLNIHIREKTDLEIEFLAYYKEDYDRHLIEDDKAKDDKAKDDNDEEIPF